MLLSSGLRPWTRGIPPRKGRKALKADDPVVFHSSEGKRAEKQRQEGREPAERPAAPDAEAPGRRNPTSAGRVKQTARRLGTE
jgi:hypothetical protein